MPFQSGDILLGKYRIEALVGQGAFAEVYRATHLALDAPRAIKVMRRNAPGLGSTDYDNLRLRFQLEAQLGNRLDHPNLVRVYDFEQDGDLFLLVMEYAHGGSLDMRIQKARGKSQLLPLDEVIQVGLEVAKGLSALHALDVVHRDLKPSNILFDQQGHAKVSDLGLAQIPGGPSRRSQLSEDSLLHRSVYAHPGTPEYMSPEQESSPKYLMPASDVYSLGLILFEMLTGRLYKNLRSGTRAQTLRSDTPAWLDDLLDGMLSKNPAERPLDGKELLARLQECPQILRPADAVEEKQASPSPTSRSTFKLPVQHHAEESPKGIVPGRSKSRHWFRIAAGLSILILLALLGIWLGTHDLVTAGTATQTSVPLVSPSIEEIISIIPTESPTPGLPTMPSFPVLAGTPYPYPASVILPENAGLVREIVQWGAGKLNQVAYSPDGQYIAVASSIGIYLHASETLEVIRFLPISASVTTVKFSPDGSILASVSADHVMRLWGIPDGSLLHAVDDVDCLATFSPDGETLITGSADAIQLWQPVEGTLIRTIPGVPCSQAVSPDGQILASADENGSVALYQVTDGTLEITLDSSTTRPVNCMAFSPDGRTLAVGLYFGPIQLWRVADGSLVRTLEGHTTGADSIAFSSDGQTMASGSEDNTVRIWQVLDGSLLHVLAGHLDWVVSVAFSPDGQTLVSGSQDHMLRLWSVPDGNLVTTLAGDMGRVNSIAFSPDGTILGSGSDDKKVRLWQLSDGSLLQVLEQNTYSVESVAFSPDGQTIASGSYGRIQLWQVANGILLRTMEGNAAWINSLAFSPDGNLLVSGPSGAIQIWQAEDGSLIQTLEGDSSGEVALSTDGQVLASIMWNQTLQLWQIPGGDPLLTIERVLGSAVAISPDGQILASGGDKIQLLSVADGSLLRMIDGNTNWVSNLAFSPDGKMLASASQDGHLQLWQVLDGRLLQTLEGHTENVVAITFSPDGRILASGSWDGTIRLWGVLP